jgi:cell wall-associated NlpC family hydrolase
MSPSDDVGRAATLLERLLLDTALRERFRREPALVCAEYGLADVAEDIAGGRHALETLELRESRSSFAGALMAAAGEGAHAVEAMQHLQEHGRLTDEASRAVDKALASPRVNALLEHAQAGPAAPPPSGHAGSGVFSALAPETRHGGGAPNTMQLGVPVHHDAVAPDAATALADPSDGYPGDNAARETIAAWMARQAHKAGLPGELPVMAALVESNLHNDQFGDRDSLGFFQMRASIWESSYPGYEHHPELQLKWFVDHALAVRAEHAAAGERSFGESDSDWGRWIADVEQPAAQYRGRYQLRLDEARALLHDAGPPSQAPDAAAAAADAAAGAGTTASPGGQAVVQLAERYLGTPYRWGGASPATGFDCSGLVEWVYGHHGVQLPHFAASQFELGAQVPHAADLQVGDVVFFRDATGYVHHEGIYVGNGKFIHAPHTGDVVKISSLDEPYYAQQFAGGRRFLDGGVPVPDAGATPPEQTGSGVFGALGPQQSQAAGGGNTVQFLPAVDPSQGDEG